MADEDIKHESRVINYLMEAETVSAGIMLRDLKSMDEVRQFYAGWSHFSWLEECKQMVKVLSDTMKLKKLGFTLEYTKKKMKATTGIAIAERRSC